MPANFLPGPGEEEEEEEEEEGFVCDQEHWGQMLDTEKFPVPSPNIPEIRRCIPRRQQSEREHATEGGFRREGT